MQINTVELSPLTKLEIKQRFWAKKKGSAPTVECACGCGAEMKSVDDYGRSKRFLTGHNRRKYDSADKYAHQKAWVKRNRGWKNNWRKQVSRERKIILMRLKGAACEKCGVQYNGQNGAMFHFHHTDPSNKRLDVGGNLTNVPMGMLVVEVAKCQLLCSNCHIIEHLGEW